MTTGVAVDVGVLGEVHSGMLRNSRAISAAATRDVLALTYGKQVRSYERPVQYAISPERLTGVDCMMPAGANARVRGIGTVCSRVMITGGHVVQSSAFARATTSTARRRLPWSHYLSQPGVLELIGGKLAHQQRVAEGFLAGNWTADSLNLSAIAIRALDSVQSHDRLDHRAPFQTPRTTLRWAMGPAQDGSTAIAYTLAGNTLRTVRLPRIDADMRTVAGLVEDIALHDWLLSALLLIVGRSQIGSSSRQDVVARLRPAVDFLLHLWMPAARMGNEIAALWTGMEQHPGLSRQWRVNVDRIRDQFALAQLETAGPTST